MTDKKTLQKIDLITKKWLDQNLTVSEYNEGTKEQLNYYLDEANCKVGEKAYLYSYEDQAITKMTILHVISRNDDPKTYDKLIQDDDCLIDGEDAYEADTSAEFITDTNCYLVWFKYQETGS